MHKGQPGGKHEGSCWKICQEVLRAGTTAGAEAGARILIANSVIREVKAGNAVEKGKPVAGG